MMIAPPQARRLLIVLFRKPGFWLGLMMLLWPPLWGQEDSSRYGGTVLIGLKGDFDSLNELRAADSDALQVIQFMLFRSLTRLDEHLQFAPDLAQSWRFSHGDSVVTFELRRDVRWSDGVPTTAEDVWFTWRLAIDPEVGYPAASRFDLVDTVIVAGRYEVQFRLRRPYPDVLYDLQMPILPKHVLEKIPPDSLSAAPFNRQPIGNGPFILKEWKANRRVVLEANPNYPPQRPYLNRVVFTIIPDETVLLNSLLTGEVDVVPSLTPLGFRQAQEHPQVRAIRYQGRNFTFVGWNNRHPFFTVQVRRALTHAINKQEIIQTLLQGFAQPANGPLLPFVWAYDPELPTLEFDPEKARRLLAEAGWQDTDGDGVREKNGQPFEFSLKTNAGNQIRRDVAVMIQAQLRQIGVRVNVDIVEWNLLIRQVFGEKDFDALILGWDADFTVNPAPLWHCRAIEEGYNLVSYCNPRVDSLLELGRSISDRERARPIWGEFQRIIVEEAPYTFLFIPDQLAGVRRRVHGVDMDVRGFLAGITGWWIPAQQRKYKSRQSYRR